MDIDNRVNELLKSPRGISEVFRAGVTIEEAKKEISQRTQGIANFGKRYLGKEPKVSQICPLVLVDLTKFSQKDAKLSNTRSKDVESFMSIPGVHEIEEDMLSPTFGIKGKVDACVEVVIEEQELVRQSNLYLMTSKLS